MHLINKWKLIDWALHTFVYDRTLHKNADLFKAER